MRPLLEKNSEVFIRYNDAIGILNKVQAYNEPSFMSLVSTQKPFGLRTFVQGKKEVFDNSVKLFQNGGVGYISRSEIKQNEKWIDQYKILVPRSSPGSDVYPHLVLGKPILSPPNSCCTETYVVIGPFENPDFCLNVMSYIRSRFFRFLVILIKNTQDVPRRVYGLVPMQDFDQKWSDEKLFAKYGISVQEQEFIMTLVKPMELGD